MPRSTLTERAQRRRRLLELLEGGLTATQDDIRRRLQDEGFTVTQATVSRDLHDLGALRDGNGRYALPARNGPPAGVGRRVFAELVCDVASSGTLVVVKTFPGMASTVAAVLDGDGVPGVLGTVAGDDTVLVVADEKTGAGKVARRIKELAS